MSLEILKKKLPLLDFETDTSLSSLLFTVSDEHTEQDVSFDEILILNDAKSLGAAAVYFRRINDRSSIPQIFIFDNTDGTLSFDQLEDIHRKIWSSGIVPLYYVFDNTDIRIFNSRKPLQKKGKSLFLEPFEILEIVPKVHAEFKNHTKSKQFSAKLFENGSFWETEENKKRFVADNSSYNKLISELRRIRRKFIKDKNETICNKLLVLSILVKYLEERKDSNGTHVLSNEYFAKYDGASSFCDVLRKNKCVQFFEDLGSDINGKIFELAETEKKEIQKIDQSELAGFLDAKRDKEQFVFWKLYDFNYVPVELISRIYEEFIPNRKDITYTPSHLVNFMVDECMPVSKPQSKFTLIDVSCGSGIFLVAAFKRMVQWWQKEQYEKKGKILPPKIRTLKSILKKSIYGVDLEGEAARLTIFSLTVALCDMLDPTIMWDELTKEKLDDLSGNITTQDFFDFINTNDKFDLIIGNPPFNMPFDRKEERDEYWNELTKKIDFDFEIPQKKIALLFLQQAMKLLKKDGLLSLVMPSGALLYNETLAYRKEFMEKYNVSKIFDFSCLRSVLFEKNVSASVIFAQNRPPDDKEILHVVVRRSITAKEKLYFEIDKYDVYHVSKEMAMTEQLIWKINLLGGDYLYSLFKRTRDLISLEEFLKQKKKRCKWAYGTGYFVGEEREPSGNNKNKRRPAKHLSGKAMIPTDKFNNDTIKEKDIVIERETLFEGRREKNKAIFKAPHILIKTRIELPVLLYNKDIIFRRDITGIHAPKDEYYELVKLEDNLRKNRLTYQALLMLTSGRIGIGRENSIRQKDILMLPNPNDSNVLKLSKAEQILCNDILTYNFEQLIEGEDAKINVQEASDKDIATFTEVFCTSLNSIYKKDSKQFYALDHIESVSFICQSFEYGNPEKPKKLARFKRSQIESGNINCLIDNPQNTNILYKRIIKLYEKNRVYLIKPKKLRYWLKSVALRDANEIFTDLRSSGY